MSCNIISHDSNFQQHLQSVADKAAKNTDHLGSIDITIGHHSFNQNTSLRSQEIAALMDLSRRCDLVFVTDTEIHDDHWTLEYDGIPNNIFFMGPGQANGNWIAWMSFYSDLQKIYRPLPHVLDELRPWQVKPLAFDALLGMIKPHRSFIRDRILADGVGLKFHLRYDSLRGPDWQSQGWIWPEGVEIRHSSQDMHADVVYHGQVIAKASCSIKTPVSFCLPVSVYNQSCYSIVAETNWQNSVHMVTEKSGRCMIARRLFVVFAGRGYLRYLRTNGFQTFDNVIDESYDEIEDDLERWQSAWQQVLWLCEQPQDMILDQARPAIEHNFRRIMTCDFFEETKMHLYHMIKRSITDKTHAC